MVGLGAVDTRLCLSVVRLDGVEFFSEDQRLSVRLY